MCRNQGTNIQAFSVHPGIIFTGLWKNNPILTPILKLGSSLFAKSPEQVRVLLSNKVAVVSVRLIWVL